VTPDAPLPEPRTAESPPNDAPAAAAAPSAAAVASDTRRPWLAIGVLGVLALGALGLAWRAEQRVGSVELELVRRQQDSAAQSGEARLIAKQAQEGMLDTAAKVALLEARVAEVAIQRTQLEDLIQSLSRSRDENIVVDIEAAVRVALQQSAITGSAEPLVATLKQADERLARYNQPRLEGVRRAVARDLDRVRAVSVADVSTLSIKLDEVVRMVDELPLLSSADGRTADRVAPSRAASAAASQAAAEAAPERGGLALPPAWVSAWDDFVARVWSETRSLIRVTRIGHPEAMLVAPEQAFFLKENLKLRLLNARLALLSRQFATAQSDLTSVQAALERYFDRGAKRTQLAVELVRQVAAQARQVSLPRPDDTLAALAAAAAGR